MGDGERRPPRPSSADLLDRQKRFFEDWEEDRTNGITPRSTYKMLETHLKDDKTFQEGTLSRLASLETGAKRDAEERQWGPNGTGRHWLPPGSIPQPPKTPSFRPWWGQEPWKSIIRYAAIVVVSMAAGAVAHHYALPPPPASPDTGHVPH